MKKIIKEVNTVIIECENADEALYVKDILEMMKLEKDIHVYECWASGRYVEWQGPISWARKAVKLAEQDEQPSFFI